MAWTSLSVKEETKERFKEAKAQIDDEQSGVPDLSDDQFLKCVLDTHEKVREHGYGHNETDSKTAPDVDEIAETVVQRLEGSKPLEDMAFDDWFEPDHAQTVAVKIVDELDGMELAWDEPEPTSDLEREIQKTKELAERAANNTDQIKERMQ